MTAAWEDPRIANGMKQQLRQRRELLRSGQEPIGWKLAFGGPAAMERLHINAPLVGFLMKDGVVASGSTLSLAGWKKPAVEPEIAVHLGRDLAEGSDRATTMAAIAGLGPAIEVADVDHPADDVEGTLIRNIYQRHVILGGCDASHAGGVLTGLTGRVFRDDTEIANTTDFEPLTGELIEVVRHVANLLAALGEMLQAGQIIISGSIIPPLWVQPGERIGFHLEPLDPISVGFATESRR